MINKERLKDAGYRFFAGEHGSKGCVGLWQKRVEAGSVTLYFISIYEFDFDNFRMPEAAKARYRFHVENAYNRGEHAFRFEILCPESVEQIEEESKRFFNAMEMDPYEE